VTGPEVFVAIICGFFLGLIVLNMGGTQGLIAITTAVGACAVLAQVMQFRKSGTRRKAIRKMWRR
jgi:hypothetical protein